MLDFDDEFVEFKLKGKVYRVKKPSNGEIKEYSKSLLKCENDDEKSEALISFLEKLGLSKEVSDMLSPSQLKMVIEALYDSSKN